MDDENSEVPTPKERRFSWGKLVAALTAAATIIGGVAAGIQIYNETKSSPPKSASETKVEKLEAGWRRETLDSGATVAMPESWKPVDRDGLVSLLKSTDGPFASNPFANLGPTDKISFVVEHSTDPDAPTVFATFADVERTGTQTLDENVEGMKSQPNCQTASKVNLPQGDAAHAIFKQWLRGPDGYEFPVLVDAYLIPKYGRLWIAALYIDERDHLPYSGTFRKIVESFKPVIPEPPPPGYPSGGP